MARKLTTLQHKDALEAAGVNVSGKPSFLPELYTTDMDGLARYMRDIDSLQYIQRYKWKGLPKNIPSWRVEQMLYYRGSLALFKAGKEYYILPYASTKGINLIGLPNAIQPVSFNGEAPEKDGARLLGDKELVINNKGGYDENADAVILYDKYNAIVNPTGVVSRWAMVLPILHEICNRFAYLGINLRNSQGKYLIICKDEKTAGVVSQQLDQLFASAKNYALVRSMFEVQVINNQVDYQEQQIWEDIASWNSLRLEGIGVEHNGLFNKKERQINGELSGVKNQTNAILLNGLKARQDFVEQAKELFGNDPDFKEQFGEDFGVELEDYLKEDTTPEEEADTEDGGEDYGND